MKAHLSGKKRPEDRSSGSLGRPGGRAGSGNRGSRTGPDRARGRGLDIRARFAHKRGMRDPTRILFVCLGNICRSPVAEQVCAQLAAQSPLGARLALDSAGTGAWHVGESPDRRMQQAAREAGFRLAGAARAVEDGDFERFDLILAMDRQNLAELRRRCPDGLRDKIRLFGDFDPEGQAEVPDPYYGGEDGFAAVVQQVIRTNQALLAQLAQGQLTPPAG